MRAICKLCEKNSNLIRAHIIPRSFFATDTFYLSSDNLYKIRRPTGVYDSEILCGNCDGYLNKEYDNYAKRILIDRIGIVSKLVGGEGGTIKFYTLLDKKGYDRLARFFISVFWRASISSHKDFIKFSLGPYQDLAKKTILDCEFNYTKYFSINLCYFPNHSSPIHIITSKRTRIENINFYINMIGFFKVFFKCDKRELPLTLLPFSLSNENNFLMFEDDITNHPENKILFDIVKKYQESKVIHSKNY